jgi:endonuclease III
MAIIPQEKWILVSHQLILHGRSLCSARKTELCRLPHFANLLRERQEHLDHRQHQARKKAIAPP